MAEDAYRTNARVRLNRIATIEAYAAATEASADLYELFTTGRSAEAWALLAGLTRAELVNAAIDMACYLETLGTAAAWGDILARWETRLGELATAAEAVALAEVEAMQAKVTAAEEAAEAVSLAVFVATANACVTTLAPLADAYFARRHERARLAHEGQLPPRKRGGL